MGLEWMLRPKDNTEREPAMTSDKLEEPQPEEVYPLHQLSCKAELNPYLENNESGYPKVKDRKKVGGASLRLKAVKHAQEQAAHEGRNFKEGVELKGVLFRRVFFSFFVMLLRMIQ
ncbi:hypothetical protein RHMOL_Rhmol03G0266000 [Rhododendron molle]|uniref:Uncharacterized protein n=1 Tax=Rhododendron molle TaxID=49168 RepID=A0ACC0PK65_RHOML|nr:hypothetical protein RHMOL_Rhmol03G0266000 [Rhododendron molle]